MAESAEVPQEYPEGDKNIGFTVVPDVVAEANILTEAYNLTSGERAAAYGHPSVNWGTTRDIFNAATGLNLTIEQCVIFAMAMKLARLRQTPNHRDSVVDLAGYSWVYSKVMAPKTPVEVQP